MTFPKKLNSNAPYCIESSDQKYSGYINLETVCEVVLLHIYF